MEAAISIHPQFFSQADIIRLSALNGMLTSKADAVVRTQDTVTFLNGRIGQAVWRELVCWAQCK